MLFPYPFDSGGGHIIGKARGHRHHVAYRNRKLQRMQVACLVYNLRVGIGGKIARNRIAGRQQALFHQLHCRHSGNRLGGGIKIDLLVAMDGFACGNISYPYIKGKDLLVLMPYAAGSTGYAVAIRKRL